MKSGKMNTQDNLPDQWTHREVKKIGNIFLK